MHDAAPSPPPDRPAGRALWPALRQARGECVCLFFSCNIGTFTWLRTSGTTSPPWGNVPPTLFIRLSMMFPYLSDSLSAGPAVRPARPLQPGLVARRAGLPHSAALQVGNTCERVGSRVWLESVLLSCMAQAGLHVSPQASPVAQSSAHLVRVLCCSQLLSYVPRDSHAYTSISTPGWFQFWQCALHLEVGCCVSGERIAGALLWVAQAGCSSVSASAFRGTVTRVAHCGR